MHQVARTIDFSVEKTMNELGICSARRIVFEDREPSIDEDHWEFEE
jgi:hypothetical protein